jgi:CheY-like chemotaxis protein
VVIVPGDAPAAGCDDYATKPIERATVLGIIHRLASGAQHTT